MKTNTLEIESAIQKGMGELALRREETLRLFRALPHQEEFFKSTAQERLVGGGNRGGKSICSAVEFASAALGVNVCDHSGKEIPFKFPRDVTLSLWTVGLGQAHVGQTIHRLLFTTKHGLWTIDVGNGVEIYNAENAEHVANKRSRRRANPLIPSRFITDIAWVDKKQNVFSSVTLINGNQIFAYSSKADVKQGDVADAVWIDEDIERPKDYDEFLARIAETEGRIWWSSWPRTANSALSSLKKRADAHKHEENPDPIRFQWAFSENPYIDAAQKKKTIQAWTEQGDAVVRARDKGEFVLDHVLMYPNYSPEVYGVKDLDDPEAAKFDKILQKRAFQPPHDWTRYLVMDPGHTVCSIGFFAVPPPFEYGDHVVMYDELYLRHYDAKQVAEAVWPKVAGYSFQKFIIDRQYGQQSASGTGKKFHMIYGEEFAARGIVSATGSSTFQFSAKLNIASGILNVRQMLQIRHCGTSRFRIVTKNTPNFHDEIGCYNKKVTQDESQEEPASGQADHSMDVLRYLCTDGAPYVPVVNMPVAESPVMKIFNEVWLKKGKEKSMSVQCGPGSLN